MNGWLSGRHSSLKKLDAKKRKPNAESGSAWLGWNEDG
jgi:hypothetical protein